MHSRFQLQCIFQFLFLNLFCLSLEEERAGRTANVSGDFVYKYICVHVSVLWCRHTNTCTHSSIHLNMVSPCPSPGLRFYTPELFIHKISRFFKIETDQLSDMSESSVAETNVSSLDCDSDSDDACRKAELDGLKNATDLVAPSDLTGRSCFRHKKSHKLHFVDKQLLGIKHFKCGRKCNENYEQLTEVPAFSLHGCMTCFGWSDKPGGEDSEPEA